MEFLQVKNKYGIPESEQYRSLQVRHWVLQPEMKAQGSRKLTKYEKWLLTRQSDKGLITDLYGMLRCTPLKQFSPSQKRWHRELEGALTHGEWEGICYRSSHTFRNAAGKETATKIATYWYLTPMRLHKFHPNRSPTCWRGCDQDGTLLHLLWGCPELSNYWTKILDNVDDLFDTQIPRHPVYVILGLPNLITYPLKSKRGRQMGLALGAAIQNILTHWGSPTISTHTGWLHKLWYILGMERIFSTLTNTFTKTWSPFISLLSTEFHELTQPKYLRVLHLADLWTDTTRQPTE